MIKISQILFQLIEISKLLTLVSDVMMIIGFKFRFLHQELSQELNIGGPNLKIII
jgi:hypothetical protein